MGHQGRAARARKKNAPKDGQHLAQVHGVAVAVQQRQRCRMRIALHEVEDRGSADRGVLDMTLMMSCRHHVIANSSFSWWGAWLNPHEDKIVVAPKRWFSGASLDTRDLIPSSWVRL